MQGYLVPASGEPALPLELEQVKQAGRARAQREFSLELLKYAMRHMAKDAGAQSVSKLAASQQAYEDLAGAGLLGAESMDKEAFVGSLLRLGRRGAASMARRGGGVGRVGKFLQRPVQSPVQAFRTGPGSAHVRVRSPLGRAPGTPPPIPKAGPRAGPYRTPQRPTKITPEVAAISGPQAQAAALAQGSRGAAGAGAKGSKDLVSQTVSQGKKEPGLVSGMLRSVALPAAALGLGYGVYRGGKGLINMAQQQAQMPPAYGYGVRQYQYGFTPEGQAQF